MPVQLDLFGSPLRPPKKIREDEAPATAAPVEKEAEKTAPVESYVAVIHPKENKQGWHTVTTSEQPEEQPLEEEADATGVNEEAAIGQEAFEEEEPAADTEIAPTEQPPAEEELVGAETTADDDTEVVEEASIDNEDLATEQPETEGLENFTEEEIEEPEEVEDIEEAEPAEEESIADEFADSSSDDIIDEEPEPVIDEEPAAGEEKEEAVEDEPETFLAEETEESVEEYSETEDAEVFSVQEIDEAEALALGETVNDTAMGQEATTAETANEEIETEGTESFSEPELPEADEPEPVLEEPEIEEEETANDAQAQTDPDGIIEDELAAEEDIVSAETSTTAATATEEPVGKRGRKPIQDYDEDAGHLNVPPDEDLFKRQYYSMRETAAMFGVNQSLLRFWENEFKILQPKKNKKGDRYFRPVDVKNLVLIHHLLRVRKFTMEGAKEYLQSNKKAGDAFELGKRLEKLKSFLLELKASL